MVLYPARRNGAAQFAKKFFCGHGFRVGSEKSMLFSVWDGVTILEGRAEVSAWKSAEHEKNKISEAVGMKRQADLLVDSLSVLHREDIADVFAGHN